jgi:hypothetical protein
LRRDFDHLRVDVIETQEKTAASAAGLEFLEYGKSIPMPPAPTWVKWSREAIGRLE